MKKRNQYRALLALQRVPEIGVRRIQILLKSNKSEDANDIFRMSIPDLMRIESIGEGVAKNIVQFSDWDAVDRILDQTHKLGANLISIEDENYPPLLRHIYDPPILLWLKGNPENLRTDGIAVIGTRRPGKYGSDQAASWSHRIAETGLTVNSGLAYGIDTIAHRTALASGGRTIAVLGSGIDVIYPVKNKPIVAEIIEKESTVISEYPPGTAPDAINFPSRNRIVSGMSHGVLVIESGIKGGSMITARSALDQNREVFVVPHPLGNRFGEGCNYLIRTGQGKLIQSMQDILDEISPGAMSGILNAKLKVAKPEMKGIKWKSLELSDAESEICKMMSEKEMHIDQISKMIGRPVFTLHLDLLSLELQGAVRQKAGKYFELC
ncbi:MAG: DNA-processing protein DprA [Balneolaceae bacterium]